MADEARKRCGELSGSLSKAGKPCGAYARAGKTTCMSHADEAEKAEVGFGGAENGRKGGEARRVPKLTEVLREKVADRADEIMDRLLEGLVAERAIVVGTGPKAYVESVPDMEMRLRTIREILDRLEGRPKSTSEFKGTVEHRNGDQLQKAIAKEIERLKDRLAQQAHDQPAAT